MCKRISILGSTGSIGVQSLDVCREFPDRLTVVALSAGRNMRRLKQQIVAFKPSIVAVQDDGDRYDIESFCLNEGLNVSVYSGSEGLNIAATEGNIDLLLVAIVGTAGLAPTYAAIQKDISVALACKEILVAAGELVMSEARKRQVSVLPIDSEHAALKQCLAAVDEDVSLLSRVVLTASGGPFWQRPFDTFSSITIDDALQHPSWQMGPKITIDSATMMNKGLEVIEAHFLFDIPFDRIDVVIHPKSIVHCLVEWLDGTFLVQMGVADMRFPIQYALTYPEKLENQWPKLDLTSIGSLDFHQPNDAMFPLLRLAYDAGKAGGSAPIVMNAANEMAVHRFLSGQIAFADIYSLVNDQVSSYAHHHVSSVEEVLEIDDMIRQEVAVSHG